MGKTAVFGKYRKCILLSVLGLVLNLPPFFWSMSIVQWTFPLGTSSFTIAPGILLCVITLIFSIQRYRHARHLPDSDV